jgi:adenylosuccinate synthase
MLQVSLAVLPEPCVGYAILAPEDGMPLDLILGAQWGDEGKGRITDVLARDADVVVRFSGGDNAGHSINVGDDLLKLHLIPSGILHPNTTCVLAAGMVINPETLIEELDQLAARGLDVTPARISISPSAHLITPLHRLLDGADDAHRSAPIGTTRRGIGPAYMDKAARRGLRVGELQNWAAFSHHLQTHIDHANRLLEDVYGQPPLDGRRLLEAFKVYAERLVPYTGQVEARIASALEQGRNILGEGAQGTLLDLDHGTYPYVTSSHPTTAGALASIGVGPGYLRRVIGVAKSFQTRVGEGPFPTELEGSLAERLRGSGEHAWDEFGTTTGRPRRCGWLDGVLLRYSARVNGFNELALTKLDILSGLQELHLASQYTFQGQVFTDLPCTPAELVSCEPVYESLPGWETELGGLRDWEDLPEAARAYVQRIEAQTRLPASMISIGPERDQLIQRRAA